MTRPKSPSLISGAQFIAIVVLTITLFLIVDFGRRATTGYYVAQAEETLKAQIQVELTRQAQLKANRDYVTSDEYVEKWAREEAHMVHPGDRPLVVVTTEAWPSLPDGSEPVSLVAPPTPAPPWHAWWRLFLDTQPGTLRAE